VDLPGEVNIKEQLSTLIQEEHERSKSLGVSFPEIDIREIWSRLLSPYGSLSDTQIEVIATSYEVQVNPVWPMPNLSLTLSSLMESNLELGVISNAQFYTHALFPALLPSLSPPFNPDLCLYSYQERQAKPGLFMFKKMVSLLEGKNIKPEETLYLGNDMRNDIDPAHRVGFRTILFAGDARSYRPREDARYSPADAVITDLSQLQELI